MSDKSLLARIEKLENRNQRVEADKAWETSWVRRILIILLTYFTISAYLYFVIHINPWLNALVPATGFLLSTLTLRAAKKIWLERR